MTWLLLTIGLLAEDPFAQPVADELARQWGEKFLMLRGGLPPEENRFPLMFEPSLPQAKAIRRPDGSVTAIIVPDQGLVADPNHPSLDQERGMPVGWLFVQGIRPAGIDQAKLPTISAKEGQWSGIFWMVQLSAKQIGPSEYRLEFWSREEKPIYGVDLRATRSATGQPIDLEETTGTLTLYALGRFAAFIPVEVVSP
jgi:hypothetical protein